MPWSNQTGGGWKGSNNNNGGPWGQGPRGNGPNPPDLEELLRRSQDKLRRVLPGGGGRGGGSGSGSFNPVLVLIAAALVVAFVGYNFFTFRVEPDEQGVVLRFGKYVRDARPGLNLRWPYPIETVYTPQVTRVNRITIGSAQEGSNAGRTIPQESLMLTGDENIVDIDFAVFWVINNARDYLFNIQNPKGTVRAVAESAMREVIGRSDIQRVLTEDRLSIQNTVQQLMQEKLNQYKAGIQVTQVQLLTVAPPPEVIDAFRDVQAAAQDQAVRELQPDPSLDQPAPCLVRCEGRHIVDAEIAQHGRDLRRRDVTADNALAGIGLDAVDLAIMIGQPPPDRQQEAGDHMQGAGGELRDGSDFRLPQLAKPFPVGRLPKSFGKGVETEAQLVRRT